MRLAESKALLKLEQYSGAYCLAGYAVEWALKAVIAKQTVRHDFPDKKRVDASYTHDLKTLVKTEGMEPPPDRSEFQRSNLCGELGIGC